MASSAGIRVVPRHDGLRLTGFVVLGRAPEDTVEWAHILFAMVHRVAVHPLVLSASTVFVAVDVPKDERPDSDDDLLMRVAALGPVAGPDAPEAGSLGGLDPIGIAVVHPLGTARSAHADTESAVAAGCLLLPGVPQVGLDHRAAWAEVRQDGELAHIGSSAHADVERDPDVAVLATLLAA
ncbi:MAG: hypothetical protein ACTHNT_11400 [Actinomycetales bacterium]